MKRFTVFVPYQAEMINVLGTISCNGGVVIEVKTESLNGNFVYQVTYIDTNIKKKKRKNETTGL